MEFWSKSFIPTLKESPAEAEIASHKLLIRAGLIRRIGAGVYSYLPLGLRALRKIENICREEMNRAGAVEVLLPALHPAELWQKGPRWNAAREVMYSVGDASAEAKKQEEVQQVLGPTHEEIITPLIGNEISSYRDLPQNLYQIQMKFRNEIRPRFGLMRAREFLMKDGYSFDVNDEEASKVYAAMREAYKAFFTRCGLNYVIVEADTGVMGGSFSHEFMVPAEIGDDDIVFCRESGYAANREKAQSKLIADDFVDLEPVGALEEFATPGVTTIADLAAEPHNVPAEEQFKTLVYICDGKPVVILLRGEDDLEEAKLGSLGYSLFRPATTEEVQEIFGANPGSLGAVKGTIPGLEKLDGVFADETIRLIGNGVTGANKDGFHIRNVNVKRDLEITRFGDFRSVRAGEPCPISGKPLEIRRAIEVGHVFKLGTTYSEAFDATFTDEDGKLRPMVMGCYGIGVSRTLQAVIEQGHDADGINWPWNVAPYQVEVVLLDPADEEVRETGIALARAAEEAGADVLVDDRKERPGVKFKDADLIGIPLRVTVGGRGLKEGVIEIKRRSQKDFEKVPLAEAAGRLKELIFEKSKVE
ncbi:MAG TPA: proline--tRNA ligase [Opitutales bacterium]|nr:proline--tRNA ligase [Opitutales bacterium]